MTSFAPLHTGQFVVKLRRIKRVRLWRAAMCAAALLAVYVVFELGRSLAGYSAANSLQAQWNLHQELAALQSDNDKLRHELDSAQLTVQMDRQASATLQNTLSEVQDNLQKQNEELVFYRGIVAPQINASTQPTVQRMEILPGNDAQHYQLHLVLIQAAQVTTQAQGTVVITVTGQHQGHQVQLTLKQLAPELAADALKFSYRYFQNIQQAIELPEGFEARSIEVELRSNSHPVKQEQYAWQPGVVLQSSPQVSS